MNTESTESGRPPSPATAPESVACEKQEETRLEVVEVESIGTLPVDNPKSDHHRSLAPQALNIAPLAQVAATFLAFTGSVLLGYYVFLNNQRADLSIRIRENGVAIAEKLRNHKTGATVLPFTVDPASIAVTFAANPDLTREEVLSAIASDLAPSFFSQWLIMPKLPVLTAVPCIEGRMAQLAFWTVTEAIDTLSPDNLEIPNRATSFAVRERSMEQENLFPFGPYGVSDWLQRFAVVRTGVDQLVSTWMARDLVVDYHQLIAETDRAGEVELAKALRSFDYANWLAMESSFISDLDRLFRQTKDLDFRRHTASMAHAIPHLRWILSIMFACVIVNVLIPHIVLARGLGTRSLRLLSLLLITFLVLGMSAVVMLVLIQPGDPDEAEYERIRYLEPLRARLEKDVAQGFQTVRFDDTVARDIYAHRTRLAVPRNLIDKAIEYKARLQSANLASVAMADLLAGQFQSSAVVAAFKSDGREGGWSPSILRFLGDSGRKNTLRENLLSQGSVIFSRDLFDGWSQTVIAVHRPENAEELARLIDEIDGIYSAAEQNALYHAFSSTRARLKESQMTMLDLLR